SPTFEPCSTIRYARSRAPRDMSSRTTSPILETFVFSLSSSSNGAMTFPSWRGAQEPSSSAFSGRQRELVLRCLRHLGLAALLHDVLEKVRAQGVSLLGEVEPDVIEVIELEGAIPAQRGGDVVASFREVIEPREGAVGGARLGPRVEFRAAKLDR